MTNFASIGKDIGSQFSKMLLEAGKDKKRVIAVYAGRFQPFHAGHYSVYKDMVDKFGKENVFIGTSGVTDPVRSPFSFDEKQMIISKMFDVPPEQIVKTKNPFKPEEILSRFDPENTAYVTAFSEKDAGRLGQTGKYFRELPKGQEQKDMKGYLDGGYYYVAPVFKLEIGGKNVSGTQARALFGDPSLSMDQKKALMKKIYGKVDPEILKLIVGKTSAAEKAKRSTQVDPRKTKKRTVDLDKKIKNPKTGREILARSALSYGSGHPAYRVAKKALQMEAFLFEGVNDPGILKAVILAGGPGSGKSYTGSKLFDVPEGASFGASGLKVVNSDPFFEYLLKKNGYSLDLDSLDDEEFKKVTDPNDPNSIRNRAKKLYKSVYNRFKEERLGMLIDQTGHKTDKVAKQKSELEAAGYDVKLMFVFTPLEVAQERNKMRPRQLPEDLVEKVWKNSMANLEKFKEIFGEENVEIVDNSVFGQDFSKEVTSKARKFVKRPVQNPRGQKWMQQQKEKIRRPQPTPTMKKHATDDPSKQRKVAPEEPKSQRKASVMNQKVKNPETGRSILVKTALQYHKGHPARRAAVQMLQAHYSPNPRTEEQRQLNEMISRALFLKEGGAAGHMAHPFEDMNLTFGDLKKIVEMGLEGELNVEAPVTEKLDGQNIMVSYRPDKGVIFARNKGQVRNRGENAMNSTAIKQMFAGRGQIAAAFGLAADDLESAILKLSEKQKEKIFGNGSKFMSVEIIYPATQNVIPYGQNMLVFHDTTEYDDSGNPIGSGGGAGRILAGMIKQINQNIQKTFSFSGPVVVKLPRSQKFGTRKSYYLSKISKLQSQYRLNDSDEVMLWHQRWWEDFILSQANKMRYSIPGNVLNGLVLRWGFDEKGAMTINDMRSLIKDQKFLDWAVKYDKTGKIQQFKSNIAPFEQIFLELGADILQNVQGIVSMNPDSAVQSMSTDLNRAINALRRANDASKLSDFKTQLSKLQSLGMNKIAPTEGIVFMYKNKVYKLTGTFAPLNQILGMLRFS